MARNYTEAEQQTAIAKLVRTSIRREYGALGNRKTDVEFGDVQDAAAGVFILYANAPFYVVRLSATILDELNVSAVNTLQDLDDTVRATNRNVAPVDKIASLANARSALGALESATEARDTSLVRIDEVPAYQRFEQSTARFLRDYGDNISSGGNIVQTPQDARGRLAGLVSSLQAEYEEVLRRAQLVHDSIDDFDALALPASLSNAVISNSRQVISDRFDELDALSPEQRLEILRDVVLDVLATRSTVQGFGALSPTFTFLYFDGLAGPYASEDYPAISAFLQSDIPGPWVILNDTRLDLVVDGATSISVDVPESFVARVEGYILEPYDIFAADVPPSDFKNDLITLKVTNYPDLDIPLTAGTTRTPEDISSDINGAIGARPVIAEPFLPTIRFEGLTDITGAFGSQAYFEKQGGDWGDIGTEPIAGDFLQVTGSVSNDGWWFIVGTTGLPGNFFAQRVDAGTAVDEVGVNCQLGAGRRAVRIRFTDAHAAVSVGNGERIGLVTDTTVKEWAHNTLGFIYNVSVQSSRTTAGACVGFINNNPAIAPAGTPRFEASQVFEATHYAGEVRTEPTDNLKVVVVLLEAQADVTAGVSATFTVADSTGVSLGDYIAIRASIDNDINNWGEVTSVTPTTIVATMNSATVVEAGITVEVGPDYSGVALPSTLIVDNDPVDLNDGEYNIISLGGVDETGPPFELTLGRPLIQHTSLGYQSRTFQAQFGQYHLRLTSESVLLDTEMEVLVSSTAGFTFWPSLPQQDVGDTPYWSIPESPRGVEADDRLELKDTSAQAPTFTADVVDTGTNPNLLELDVTVQTDTGQYDMTQSAPAPSARVRKRKKDNFDVLKDALGIWLANPLSNSDRYFADLRKLLNPIIVNKNPTAASIAAATSHLEDLYNHLITLSGYLAIYDAPLVEQVDRLITTYQQQGSQRAVDILLESQFSGFFGLTQDESSYTGNLQKALRDVNLKDLPQRKFDRNPGGEVIDSYEEPDFEFDTSDTDAEVDLDQPDEVLDYAPGTSAF